MKRLADIFSIYQLSILRIVLVFFSGRACLHHINIIYDFQSDSPAIYFHTWFLKLLPEQLQTLHPNGEFFLEVGVIVLCAGAMAGIFGRLCLLLLSLVMFYVFGFNSAYGIFDHHNSLSSQVIFILAFIPGSMVLSIDNFLLNKFVGKKINGEEKNSQYPAWGFRLILTVVALTYFTSGLSKVRYGGIEWMDGKTLSFYLSGSVTQHPAGLRQLMIADEQHDKTWKDSVSLNAHIYGNQHRGAMAKIAKWLSDHSLLIALAAFITVIFELMGPVVFINNRWRTFYLLGAIAMHTTIGALMGLGFLQYKIICFFLIDWQYIASVINSLKLKTTV
jgi:hypothetical protein